MAIEIPLSNKQKKGTEYRGMYVAIVDDCDSEFAKLNWSVKIDKQDPSKVYAYRKEGKKNIHLHRVILENKLGKPLEKGQFPDHISGDGLDNRRDNLRIATNSQNSMNRGKNKANKSGYKGVSWGKANNKWQAQIGAHGIKYHLGYFDDPFEAYLVYCKKADELHQEYVNKG